jgi:hypothetical protein
MGAACSEATVLPFTKRAARDEASDLINTGDIEVVRPKQAASPYPSPPADRPRVFSRSVSDEEMTTLMPRKGPLAQLVQSPASQRPARRPVMDEPTRHFVRPPAAPPAPPPPTPVAFPKASVQNLARPAARPAAARQEMVPPSIAPVAMAPKQDSDAKIDPPGTVITTRTRIISPRPTVQWAAALVAVGVFVGLVSAVIARGDADSIIDATASFVDPSSTHAAAGSGNAVAGVQTKFVQPSPVIAAVVDTMAQSKDDEPKSVALSDLPTASPQPPKAAPVAYAAPIRHAWHAPHAAPAPAHVEKADKPEKEAAVAQAPAPKAPKAAAAAPKKAAEDDVESASAADALAKAQLEASLR